MIIFVAKDFFIVSYTIGYLHPEQNIKRLLDKIKAGSAVMTI